MRTAVLVCMAALCSMGASWPQPTADPTTQQVSSVERDDGLSDSHGNWAIQARDDSSTSSASESSTETTSSTTETTEMVTTSTESSATSTTSDTTSATSTLDSTTTTSSVTSTASDATTSSASKTTSTASSTTASATSTSTADAKLAERNHKGKIAAIITFTILIAVFLAVSAWSCFGKKLKSRLPARSPPKPEPIYSVMSVSEEMGPPPSAKKFDRASIMFSNSSQADLGRYTTPRGSVLMDQSQHLRTPSSRVSSG